eukprot:TRINITY_DN3749_c0_g1_i2.p1 TRINITY_DN3749_c0_g1~~TRINITY_DN3749_c0_g1_i2.p1  ORF type:complete len:387 (-),score=148.57 TRINITY_DN3749_c0_g1_i2:270-1430(-)
MDDKKKCVVCGKGEKLLRCSFCKNAFYCGVDHQREDWKTHKSTCKKPTTNTSNNITISKSTESSEKDQRTPKKNPLINENINDILQDHIVHESNYNKDLKEYGLESEKTLESAFNLFDSYISMYKLEPCQELVDKIWDICEKKGGKSEWFIKVVQARGLLRFKQHRFKDSLDDMLLLRTIVGPNIALSENIGHVYNSLGMLEEAKKSFEECIFMYSLPSAPPPQSSNKGGVLLGLGLVLERQGKPKEGLEKMFEALEFYTKKYQGKPSSLNAKTLMSIGKTQMKLEEYKNAEKTFAEATLLFKITCGDDTPLTADAILEHAKALQKLDQVEEALLELRRSLKLYSSFDNQPVYANTINEIVSLILEWSPDREELLQKIKQINEKNN